MGNSFLSFAKTSEGLQLFLFAVFVCVDQQQVELIRLRNRLELRLRLPPYMKILVGNEHAGVLRSTCDDGMYFRWSEHPEQQNREVWVDKGWYAAWLSRET